MFSINITLPRFTVNTDVTALIVTIFRSAVLVALLVACDNPFSSNNSDEGFQQTSFKVNRFNSKTGLETLNPNLYRPAVALDDSPVTMTPNTDRSQWSGNIALPTDRAFVLNVSWYYDEVLIAIFEREFGAGLTTVTVSSTDYITSGVGLDDDFDGCSNLDALRDPPVPGCPNAPAASDPTPVPELQGIDRFLGTWLSRCHRRETGTADYPFGIERMTVSDSILTGSTVVFFMQHYPTSDCITADGHGYWRTGSFTLGEEILTSDGLNATEIDFQYASAPELVRDIVRVEGNKLYLGLRLNVASDIRPTALDFVRDYNKKETNAAADQQPILGTWAYFNPAKQCTEVVHFRFLGQGDNSESWARLSATHYMDGLYQISTEPVAPDRYSLRYDVSGDNGGVDCAGKDSDGVGMKFEFFVEFVDEENINFYNSLADEEPLWRLKRAECGTFDGDTHISDCVITSPD